MTSPPVSFGHRLTSPGHVGEPAVQRDRVVPRVAAEQRDRARVGAEQPEQHADRRGLARAVRPEEAVHLAGLDDEVEPVERPGRAERLDEPGEGDRGSHGVSLAGGGGVWWHRRRYRSLGKVASMTSFGLEILSAEECASLLDEPVLRSGGRVER